MNNEVRPVTPDEVVAHKENVLPAAVLESFNELITRNFSGNQATFKQEDVVALMKRKGLKRTEIFKKGFLNVKDVYSKVGWTVEYDKPGYNESYPATFTFTKKKRA